MAALVRALGSVCAYALPALLLAWFAGGQMALGRIDAALALPWLMPGALLLARMLRDENAGVRRWRAALAFAGLAIVQILLHHGLGARFGLGQAVFVALAGYICWRVAFAFQRRTRAWRRRLRWPALLIAAILWFGAAQALLWQTYAPLSDGARPRLAILTGLPLRWTGSGDIAAMLASGPADAPALAALGEMFEVRLVDSVSEAAPGEALLVAHPRALAPAELVRLDERAHFGRPLVILADGLSAWPPPHPLGDPRNPPVTSLLTPLLDHWGIELAAPHAGVDGAGQVSAVFIDSEGRKLLFHSAGRFTRLPDRCQAYAGGRIARCAIHGDFPVWLVGDADMLHASLWQSPFDAAPWLRRSDNVEWLEAALGRDTSRALEPIWIR